MLIAFQSTIDHFNSKLRQQLGLKPMLLPQRLEETILTVNRWANHRHKSQLALKLTEGMLKSMGWERKKQLSTSGGDGKAFHPG